MTADGRHRSVGSVSVAWLSDAGPRPSNLVRAVAHVHDDGAWLLGVADGLGGHPRADETAEAALSGLPQRLSGPDEMWQAFAAANRRVALLAPSRFFEPLEPGETPTVERAPASTLCVAAWTPTGGLTVGAAGDTLALVRWHGDPAGRAVIEPHRSRLLYPERPLTRFLGQLDDWLDEPLGTDADPMETWTDADLAPAAADGLTVAVLSDGAWTRFGRLGRRGHPVGRALGQQLASVMSPEAGDARDIAQQIMEASRAKGLHDNAAVAVAHVAAQ